MSRIYTLDSLNIECLPSPCDIKQEIALKSHHFDFIHESRRQIANILDGQDDRLILILGPCSIHDLQAAKEYAANLHFLAKNVSKSFFIVMRTYFEKARTALGWKGLLYDPHLDGSHDIITGIRQARQLLLDLTDMQIPTATEFLDPISHRYLSDLISWACIGARTTESQVHRQFASGLPMPVAFKNNTSGNINAAVKGVLTASSPHAFFGIDEQGQASIIRTKGNKQAHIVLRGGANQPNYDAYSIEKALELLRKNHLSERLVIDCSHDNSARCPNKQKNVFESVIRQYLNGNSAIRGLALESNLFAGNQSIPDNKSLLQYAVSITDPCLAWEETKSLILQNAEFFKKNAEAALGNSLAE